MYRYIVSTPYLYLDCPPYAVRDRAIVFAENPEAAKQAAVNFFRKRGSDFLLLCLIDGTDPMLELTVAEFWSRSDAFDNPDYSEIDHIDVKEAVRASKLKAENKILKRRAELMTMLCAGLFAILVLSASAYFTNCGMPEKKPTTAQTKG